jgi:hypothetical protein
MNLCVCGSNGVLVVMGLGGDMCLYSVDSILAQRPAVQPGGEKGFPLTLQVFQVPEVWTKKILVVNKMQFGIDSGIAEAQFVKVH